MSSCCINLACLAGIANINPDKLHIMAMRAVVTSGTAIQQDVVIEGSTRRQTRKALQKVVTPGWNKFRTEMCRHIDETGICPYGEGCRFAHTSEELRPQVRPGSYKSTPCKTFFEEGYCNFGVRW